MFKVFILVAVIMCVGFVIYNQRTDNASQKNDVADSEERADNNSAHTDTVNLEPTVDENLTLDLRGQNLTQTPEDVFDKTNLEALDLSHNNLTGALQAEVRHLQNLRVLDISNNQLTGVPAEIGQLKKLEILNLSNNRITGLPLELGGLSNLKVLNLRGNNYSETDLQLIKKDLPSSTIIYVD